MGAETFSITKSGKTAKAAFKDAVEQAEYDFGHAGYTGTIAEKDSFVMIALPLGEASPYAHAEKLISENDDRIDDKWGPAGCIKFPNEDKFLFFGWASS